MRKKEAEKVVKEFPTESFDLLKVAPVGDFHTEQDSFDDGYPGDTDGKETIIND